MKLRLRANSLRLRLTRTEVSAFGTAGKVEEIVNFGRKGQKRLVYALERSSNGDEVAATFDNDRVCVYIPREKAHEWVSTDLVGIQASQNELTILIEKDFACAQPRIGEDESDMFANPNSDLCG
jgi:hypothetical protein